MASHAGSPAFLTGRVVFCPEVRIEVLGVKDWHVEGIAQEHYRTPTKAWSNQCPDQTGFQSPHLMDRVGRDPFQFSCPYFADLFVRVNAA